MCYILILGFDVFALFLARSVPVPCVQYLYFVLLKSHIVFAYTFLNHDEMAPIFTGIQNIQHVCHKIDRYDKIVSFISEPKGNYELLKPR